MNCDGAKMPYMALTEIHNVRLRCCAAEILGRPQPFFRPLETRALCSHRGIQVPFRSVSRLAARGDFYEVA